MGGCDAEHGGWERTETFHGFQIKGGERDGEPLLDGTGQILAKKTKFIAENW